MELETVNISLLPPEKPDPKDNFPKLVSGLGNNEIKGLVITAMEDGSIYTDADLRHRLGWKHNRGILSQYCAGSLAPISLVAREAKDPNGETWGYQITEEGKAWGIPLSGQLCQWSLDHPKFALYQMFSSTQSSAEPTEGAEDRKRAAQTRMKIFWELSTSPSNKIRITDIATAVGEYNSIVSQHIEALHKFGVINRESTLPGKKFSSYQYNPEHPNTSHQTYRTSIILTNTILEILKEHQGEDLTIPQMEDLLKLKNPRYQNYKDLDPEVSGALASLTRQEFVIAGKFRYGINSEIEMTDEQREAITSLVTILDRFQRGDPTVFTEGMTLAHAIVADQSHIDELVEKSRENSPHVEHLTPDELFSKVAIILNDSPNSTSEQIEAKMAETTGRTLNRNYLRSRLSEFVSEGRLKSAKTKSGFVYNLSLMVRPEE